jgi:hypothetical protein
VLHAIAGFDSLLLAAVTALALLYAWAARRMMRAGMHPLLTVIL